MDAASTNAVGTNNLYGKVQKDNDTKMFRNNFVTFDQRSSRSTLLSEKLKEENKVLRDKSEKKYEELKAALDDIALNVNHMKKE